MIRDRANAIGSALCELAMLIPPLGALLLIIAISRKNGARTGAP